MIDLEQLATIAEGAELPPTIREAVRALAVAPQLDLLNPPDGTVRMPVRAGVYALVEIRP